MLTSAECEIAKKEKPEDGAYLRGLFMEGASWDVHQHAITESNPRLVNNFSLCCDDHNDCDDDNDDGHGHDKERKVSDDIYTFIYLFFILIINLIAYLIVDLIIYLLLYLFIDSVIYLFIYQFII